MPPISRRSSSATDTCDSNAGSVLLRRLTCETQSRAWRQRYYAEHTSFATARFRSTVTGGQLLELYLTNILTFVFTLGIGMPWIKARTAAFHADKIILEGPVDMGAIMQDLQAANATGEGLSTILDDDTGLLDMDMGL